MMAGALWAPAFVTAQERPGRLGIRLAEGPQDRKDDPRALIYIVDHLRRGEVISRRIEISNSSAAALPVNIYPSAATIEAGAFAPAAGRADNELTKWTKVEPEALTVPPDGRVTAQVTIRVPDDAESGERYGVVFAEATPSGDGAPSAITSRVGIRVYLSVGDGDEPDTDFELPTFRPVRLPDGRPAIDIDGCNTGGRAVDLAGDVELANGPGGTKAGPFRTSNATTLAPDQCHTFTIPLDKELPNGPWDATAKLRSGKEERTAEARITFPENAGERGKKVETKEVTGTVPGIIALGISIFLLLLLAGWLLWFLLKRRKRKTDDEDEPES